MTQPTENSDLASETPNIGLTRLFAGLMACGVGLGAFGAHALRDIRTPQQLETWKTATLYLLIHALAGLALSLSARSSSLQASHSSEEAQHQCSRLHLPKSTLTLFALGCLFFAGSLYALVLTEIRILGAITPIGGVMFIAGWIILTLKARLT